jgi:threonine dehydrogenase-like Zn-dependent dehydrogenase
VKAVSFEFSWPRLAASKILGAFSPAGHLLPIGPLTYREVPDPGLRGEDWAILEVGYAGICGSDVKEVFLEGAFDNPLTALISFPHVLGHEVVGTVIETGRAVKRVKKGDRVAYYPWLTCVVRGLAPCRRCTEGDFTLCENLTSGAIAPGMHAGNCRDIPGGFAPYVAAHESMCFPIPEAVEFASAALVDPFSVSLHALGKAPPRKGDTALVIGMGSLGMMAGHILVRLFPEVRAIGVDVHEGARAIATRLGLEHFFTERGEALVDHLGQLTGAPVMRPWGGLPFLNGGVDRVYDTVGTAGSLELAVRVLKPKGTLVLVGVAPPQRFEWTLIYFKELHVIGSNGCATEEFEGQRRHGFELCLDLLAKKRVDPSPIITHTLALDEYRRGFLIAREKQRHGSIKVLLTPNGQAAH